MRSKFEKGQTVWVKGTVDHNTADFISVDFGDRTFDENSMGSGYIIIEKYTWDIVRSENVKHE